MDFYNLDIQNDRYHILSDQTRDNYSSVNNFKTAVFVNLYYEDEYEKYLRYLVPLCDICDVYIFSSNNVILEKLKKINADFFLGSKNNRGRDISAFLVTARKYVEQYDLVCFLHDKKHKYPRLKQDTDIWKFGMWTNLVHSKNYVHEIMELFHKDSSLGALFPPAPVGEYFTGWFGDLWNENYANVIDLAETLGLNIAIEQKKQPKSIGTMFWARTKTLKKLFKVEWSYETFDKEPLPDNGTLSHAIERIIGFVVEDSGYHTDYIMHENYSNWMLNDIQKKMRDVFFFLRNKNGIDDFHHFYNLDIQKKIVSEYCVLHDEVYLFGAGRYGRILLSRMREWGLSISGFIVTKKNREQIIEGFKVYELNTLNLNEKTGIIVSVNYENQDEIIHHLKSKNISDYIVPFF